ncbi:MAG: hypothetical protein K6F39_01635 [Lachnospiraceae bacterium]|nr:hypothetical protein [Lachnospiraceae bacterium]
MSNEFKFDPMTGETIKNDTAPENENSFDPMTGEPIKKADSEPDNGVEFDPMTGEPVKKGEQSQSDVQFDPMTGEPVNNDAQAGGSVQFDPMTGEPVYGGNSFSSVPAENPKKGNKAAVAVVAVIVVLIAIAGCVFAAFKLGVFKKPYEKVYDGIDKTLTSNSSHITKDLSDMVAIINSGDYNFDLDGSVDSSGYKVKGSLNYAQNSKKKQQSAVASAGVGDLEFTVSEYMTDKEIYADLGALYSRVLKYSFDDDNDGFLLKEMNKDQIKAINTFPAQFFKMTANRNKQSEAMEKTVKESMADWEIEKADPEEFEINGKDRKLNGYTVTLTGDDLSKLYKDILDQAEEENPDYYDAMDQFFGVGVYEEAKEQMLKDLVDFPETDFNVYLYKGAAAVITVDGEKDFVMNCYKGSKPLDEIEITSGEDKINVSKTDEDSVESISIKGTADGKSIKGGLDYDYKNGEIKVSAMGVSYKFNFTKEDGKYVFSTKDTKYGDVSFSLSATISKGAKIKEIKDSDALDIGKASEDDMREMVSDLQESIGGLMGGVLGGYGSSDDDYGSYGGYGSDDDYDSYDSYGSDDDYSSYGDYDSDDYSSGVTDSEGNTFSY